MPTKAIPPVENGDTKLTNAVRLGLIEQQLGFLTNSIETLGDKIDKTEDTRSANLLDYVRQHSDVVAEVKSANNKVDTLRTKFDISETSIIDKFEVVDKRFDDWETKINPLLTAHKILVWVTIFFASSIGLLLWGIFTHTVAISFIK